MHLSRAGHFFLTVAAAPEKVSRALRKQRLREGEEQLHQTVVSIWIEQARPKGDPRAGNEARVQQALQRTKERLQAQQHKRAFGRRVDFQQQQKNQAAAEANLMREYGIHDDDSAATAAAAAAAATNSAAAKKRAVVERKEDGNVERKEEEAADN